MKKFLKKEAVVVFIIFAILFSLNGFLIFKFYSFQKQKEITKTFIFPTPTPVPKKILVKGSIPYWDQKNAFESFQANVSAFDYVNLFWYYLGSDGSILKYNYAYEDRSIIDFAHANNVKVSMVLTNLPENGNWSSERVESVISNENLRQKHIENIVEKLRELNFEGVIIDYELLKPNLKEEYSNFIRELYQALQKENKILTVVLHPKTGENVRGEEISKYQDWEALAKYSDQLQIMGYSQHSDHDPPGPIAGADWVEKIIEYAKSTDVPEEKIFLGIPLYGYDWNKDSKDPAEGLTFTDVLRLFSEKEISVEYDNVTKSPYSRYGSHEVWFENARSIGAKIKLAQDNGLAGISFWRLGGEDPEVWEAIRKFSNDN